MTATPQNSIGRGMLGSVISAIRHTPSGRGISDTSLWHALNALVNGFRHGRKAILCGLTRRIARHTSSIYKSATLPSIQPNRRAEGDILFCVVSRRTRSRSRRRTDAREHSRSVLALELSVKYACNCCVDQACAMFLRLMRITTVSHWLKGSVQLRSTLNLVNLPMQLKPLPAASIS